MNTEERDMLDQCALRLPFHVNGTLDAEWNESMRSALARSESLRHSAAWLAALRTELRAVTVRESHHAGWHRIMQCIDTPTVDEKPLKVSSTPGKLARWAAALLLTLGAVALATAVRFS